MPGGDLVVLGVGRHPVPHRRRAARPPRGGRTAGRGQPAAHSPGSVTSSGRRAPRRTAACAASLSEPGPKRISGTWNFASRGVSVRGRVVGPVGRAPRRGGGAPTAGSSEARRCAMTESPARVTLSTRTTLPPSLPDDDGCPRYRRTAGDGRVSSGFSCCSARASVVRHRPYHAALDGGRRRARGRPPRPTSGGTSGARRPRRGGASGCPARASPPSCAPGARRPAAGAGRGRPPRRGRP